MRPGSIHFASDPLRFSIVLLFRFVRSSEDHLNMILLQESATVNTMLDVEQTTRFV